MKLKTEDIKICEGESECNILGKVAASGSDSDSNGDMAPEEGTKKQPLEPEKREKKELTEPEKREKKELTEPEKREKKEPVEQEEDASVVSAYGEPEEVVDSLSQGLRACCIRGSDERDGEASDGTEELVDGVSQLTLKKGQEPREDDERGDGADLEEKETVREGRRIRLVTLEEPAGAQADVEGADKKCELRKRGPAGIPVAHQYNHYHGGPPVDPGSVVWQQHQMPHNFPNYQHLQQVPPPGYDTAMAAMRGAGGGKRCMDSDLPGLYDEDATKFIRPQQMPPNNLDAPGMPLHSHSIPLSPTSGRPVNTVCAKQMSGGTVITQNGHQTAVLSPLGQQHHQQYPHLHGHHTVGEQYPHPHHTVGEEEGRVDSEELNQLLADAIAATEGQDASTLQRDLEPILTSQPFMVHHKQGYTLTQPGVVKMSPKRDSLEDGGYVTDQSPSHESAMFSPSPSSPASSGMGSSPPHPNNWSPPPSNMSLDSGVHSPMSDDGRSSYRMIKSPRSVQSPSYTAPPAEEAPVATDSQYQSEYINSHLEDLCDALSVAANDTQPSTSPASPPVLPPQQNMVMANILINSNQLPIAVVTTAPAAAAPSTMVLTTASGAPLVNQQGKVAIPPIHPRPRPLQGSTICPVVFMVPQQQAPVRPRIRTIAPKDPTKQNGENIGSTGNGKGTANVATGQTPPQPPPAPAPASTNGTGPRTNNKLNCARRLVANLERKDLEFTDNEGDTNLHVAVCRSDPNLIMALLERLLRENLKSMMDAQNIAGQTPLYLAVSINDPEKVRVLVDKGADVSLYAECAGQKKAAIHCASSKGDAHLHTLQALSTSPSFTVDQPDSQGHTALHCAILNHAKPQAGGLPINSLPIVEALLLAGANPNLQVQNGRTALMFALETESLDLFEMLLQSVDPADRVTCLRTQDSGGNSVAKMAERLKPSLAPPLQQRLHSCLKGRSASYRRGSGGNGQAVAVV